MPLPERYVEFMGWMREDLVERITELEAALRRVVDAMDEPLGENAENGEKVFDAVEHARKVLSQ